MNRIHASGVALVLGLLAACGGATPVSNAPSASPRVTPSPVVSATLPSPSSVASPAASEATATESPAAGTPTPGAPSLAPGETPGTIDLCSLVSTTRVSAVLKENAADGAAEAGSCTWAPADANGTTTLIIEQDTVDDFNGIRTVTGGVYVVTTVVGLGDDAYTSVASGTNVATLYVRKGDKVIQVGVIDDSWSVDDIIAAEKTIASEAISGL